MIALKVHGKGLKFGIYEDYGNYTVNKLIYLKYALFFISFLTIVCWLSWYPRIFKTGCSTICVLGCGLCEARWLLFSTNRHGYWFVSNNTTQKNFDVYTKLIFSISF